MARDDPSSRSPFSEVDNVTRASASPSPPPSAASTIPAQVRFRLLDLPDELISLVCDFVALQRYQYAQSRRPQPSPLFTLAHSHSKLAQFALALLHRRRQLNLDHTHHSTLTHHVRCLQAHLWPLGGPLLPTLRFDRCETLELSWGRTRSPKRAVNPLPLALETCPNIVRLELRRPEGPVPKGLVMGFAGLRAVAAFFPAPEWVAFLASLPQVTDLAIYAREDTPPLSAWCTSEIWGRLATLTYETPPFRPTARSSVHPLATALEGLVVPTHASLEHLNLSTRLQLQTAPVRSDFALLIPHLRPLASLPLTSLTLDDYVLATPAALAALALLFPALRVLAFGSRTVWHGTAAEHFAALAGFAGLRSLECPRWPEKEEPWREPEEVLAELAGCVPGLEVVGLGGQQSEDQRFRVTRGWNGGGEGGGAEREGGRVRVEKITIHNTDLDQGR